MVVDQTIYEAYSGVCVEVECGYGCDGLGECLDRAAVVGVHNPPGFEVGDGLERYSKPHEIEKKNSPRAASNASS